MPPTVFIVTILLGLVMACITPIRRCGMAIAFISAAALYVFATPLASAVLLRTLEARMPAASSNAPQAIVVLSGNIHHGDGHDIPDSVGTLTLERMDRAAALYRDTQLPILATGGPIGDSPDSLAALMARTMEHDFGVPVKWREEVSQTTFENARYSAEILRRENIRTVYLVTQPWHMARGAWSFAREGIEVIPAPTALTVLKSIDAAALLPQSASLADSFYALHEMLGLVYYRLRFG